MRVPKTQQDLANFFNRDEFVTDTVKQIAKDMTGLISTQVDFNLDMDGNVLSQITLELQFCLKQMTERNLQQFMYKVDIHQGVFLKAVAEEDDFQELAFLVVQREAQKVFLRAHYG